MGPLKRTNNSYQPPSYPEPPEADYSDMVSEDTMNDIEESVKDEFEGEELELVSGPAW